MWKIEWKHHFQKQPSEKLPFRVPFPRTAVFNQLPCPSLRSWIRRLTSGVFSVLQEDRSRGNGSTAHVNAFPMIRWVLRRMRDGGWTLLPNDKEPGFCFIRHNETRDAAKSSLVPGSYAETHFDEMRLPGLMKAHCVIAKGVGAYTREYRTCGRACRHDWHTIFVKRLVKNFSISCATRRSVWRTSGVCTGRMKCVWSR